MTAEHVGEGVARAGIPSMTSAEAHAYLEELGRLHSGHGEVVECGSWLGASAAALARGLRASDYQGAIHAYDRWTATAGEVEKADRWGVMIRVGQNLEPLFRENVEPIGIPIRCHRGSISTSHWCGQPIEIFLIDAAKEPVPFLKTLAVFGDSFVPGKTILGFMDHHCWRNCSAYRGDVLLLSRTSDPMINTA